MINNTSDADSEDREGTSINKEKLLNKNEEIIETIRITEEMTRCGIGCFQPECLQIFASKKVFVVVYAFTGMMIFATGAYSVGITSTIEKHFKIPSRMSGIISGAWDVGSVATIFTFTYIASKGHRTRWVAFGTFIAGLACFMRILPFWIFGPGEDVKIYTMEYSNSSNITSTIQNGNYSGEESLNIANDTNCIENESQNNHIISAYILIIAQIIIGASTSLYWTCGAAYLDDNVRKNIAPLLLAATQMIRLFGPTAGFLLSSYALSIYVDPYLHPTITNEDPRWIGAWWLGWYPICLLLLISSLLLAMFPKILPRAAMRKKGIQIVTKEKSVSDFWNCLKRILKNKIVMFNSFSTVCFCIGAMAYWNFMPKYMETVFNLSASKSNLIIGTVGILNAALGVLISGLVISKVKPSPRFLTGWNVFVEILDVIGHVLYSFFSCPEQKLHGYWDANNSWNLTMDCNVYNSCGGDVQYAPVCDPENEIEFYSPCYAGCSSLPKIINNTKSYEDCTCASNGIVLDGRCPVDCTTNLIFFIALMGVLRFTSATGRCANSIISFRSVSVEDKSLSIAITEGFLCLFGYMPAPIFYGMIVDFTCLVWGSDCGKTGNCWLYSGKMLRYLFNFVSSGFYALGTILDVFVWYYSKDLKIYDEDFEDNEENELKILKLLDKNPIHLNTRNHNDINKKDEKVDN